MKCPSCKESTLVLSERKGIEIDYCPDCRGIWLDRGELDKILESSRNQEQMPERSGYSHHQQPDHRYYKRKKSFLEEIFD